MALRLSCQCFCVTRSCSVCCVLYSVPSFMLLFLFLCSARRKEDGGEGTFLSFASPSFCVCVVLEGLADSCEVWSGFAGESTFVIEADIRIWIIISGISSGGESSDWTFVKVDAGIMLTPLQGNDLCLISSHPPLPHVPDPDEETNDQKDACQNKDQDGESK